MGHPDRYLDPAPCTQGHKTLGEPAAHREQEAVGLGDNQVVKEGVQRSHQVQAGDRTEAERRRCGEKEKGSRVRPFHRIPLPEFAHLIIRLHGRFIPVYFEKDIDSGIPQLTVEGRRAVEEELSESSQYPLETAPTKSA